MPKEYFISFTNHQPSQHVPIGAEIQGVMSVEERICTTESLREGGRGGYAHGQGNLATMVTHRVYNTREMTR